MCEIAGTSSNRVFTRESAFWRAFLPALLLWDIIYHVILAGLLDLAQRSVERPEWDPLIIQVALPAPMYAALFLYGYRSSAVWAGLAEPRLVIPFAFKSNAERWFAIALWGALVPFVAVWNVLAMSNVVDLGLIQMLVIALAVGLAAGIVLVAPLDILILTFIARLRPQDFAVDCQVCARTRGFGLRWPRSLRQIFLERMDRPDPMGCSWNERDPPRSIPRTGKAHRRIPYRGLSMGRLREGPSTSWQSQ